MVSLKGQRELYTSTIAVLFYEVAGVHQDVKALFYYLFGIQDSG